MRAADGGGVAVHASPGTDWTVVTEADARPRPTPLHRFIRVHPVPDGETLARALHPLAPHLAGGAVAGTEPGRKQMEECLLRLGASRICGFGELQTPPLGWRRDGRNVLPSFPV